MTTTVVHMSDRPSENWEYIGRTGKGFDGYFGNPFVMGKDGDRDTVLHKYRNYFERRVCNDGRFRIRVLALRDKVLVCFCKPLPCHGDVIAEFLNEEFDENAA